MQSIAETVNMNICDFFKLIALLFLIDFSMIESVESIAKNQSITDYIYSNRRIRHDSVDKGPSSERLLTFDESTFNYEDGTIYSNSFESHTSPKSQTEEFGSICNCYKDQKTEKRHFQDLIMNIEHRILDTSIGIVPGILYQVSIKPVRSLKSVTVCSENPKGEFFHPTRQKECPNVAHIENNSESAHKKILLNFSIPATERKTYTIRILYQLPDDNQQIYELQYNLSVAKGCKFRIRTSEGNISSSELFQGSTISYKNCSLIFYNPSSSQSTSDPTLPQSDEHKKGLIIKLSKLNVRCDSGYYITFSSNNSLKLCGKLEEILPSEREYYFSPVESRPKLIIVGKPIFAVTYQKVDFCYNVTLQKQNDSITIKPLLNIFCNFKIALPYGYRISINIFIKSNSSDFDSSGFFNESKKSDSTIGKFVISNNISDKVSFDSLDTICNGILLKFWDGSNSNSYCHNPGYEIDENTQLQYKSVDNILKFRISAANNSSANLLNFYLHYEAVAIFDINKNCPFGAIFLNSACFFLMDKIKLNWKQAESECNKRGGHLASISNENSQFVIDRMLLKSPNYHDYDSYWIGASDIGQEGDFQWTDFSSFSYTNWFGGWPQYGFYNRQPNDDGLSNQNCVELRRQFQISPSTTMTTNNNKIGGGNFSRSKSKLTSSYMWNDRNCDTKNYFICQIFVYDPGKQGQGKESGKELCNQIVTLTEENGRAVISSPHFPRDYPNNKNCLVELTAPSTYNIVLVFEEFVLEEEPNCSYDYLEILYERSNYTNYTSDGNNGQRYCGDWSDKLKLLRYVSTGPKLFLHFVSDYSYTFSGYKAHISIEHAKTDCEHRFEMFNNQCYLFVSYPRVTWQTAQEICKGIQSSLASIHGSEEEHFILSKIRESHEYSSSAVYWLGGKLDEDQIWKWIDNNSNMEFTAWLPIAHPRINYENNATGSCLGIQWIPSPSPTYPSGLYWVPISCSQVGGYVCKLQTQSSKIGFNLNRTENGTEGILNSPNYPGFYYHNLDYSIKIIGPENTRIIIQFDAFDLEQQKNCLYDFLEIFNSFDSNDTQNSNGSIKRCGYHTHQLHRLNFVSTGNIALIRFHSDYSTSGSGFFARWKAVDISGCPAQTLTAKEGTITSPNYPNFLLANLQCTTTILAPVGRQLWFEIENSDFGNKENFEENNSNSDFKFSVYLGDKEIIYPFQRDSVLTEGAYLSHGDYIKIYLKTGDMPAGKGFKGYYRTVTSEKLERIIELKNTSNGHLYHLNFPLNPLGKIHYSQRLIAPLGYSIYVQFYQVVPSLLDRGRGRTVCPLGSNGFLEVSDNFADQNGTWWQFCDSTNHDVPHLTITSYLNTLTIVQRNDNITRGVLLNASVSVVQDPNFKSKILQFPREYSIETCQPNPCSNGGKCTVQGNQKLCQCVGHFTGLFCALTICDISPCIFGVCHLTSDNFQCNCTKGYQGNLCDTKVRPCSVNPCEGRGICVEKSDLSFICQCHAWWEGEKCERKILNIPYKPLTDRMLEEPFWLGLLTVCIVLACIGLFWCAKRHFPEKLEKLLAEEADRNRQYNQSTGRNAARADFVGQNGISTNVGTPQTNTANSSPNPNSARTTIFGRLGIRKPSLFSLTSPLQPATNSSNRTFSLDDLFKTSSTSSRSQIPYSRNKQNANKKRLTGDRKNMQQSLSIDDNREIPLSAECIPLKVLSDNKPEIQIKLPPRHGTEQTSFIFPKMDTKSRVETAADVSDKIDRKVKFSSLLNKIHLDVFTTSNLEINLNCNKIEQLGKITNPNQGSDSLSNSDVTLFTTSGEKLNARRPNFLTLGTPNGTCQKAASADSLLAMFRKFSLSTGPSSECNSNIVSVSSSPTASPPPEENVGSDDSLSSYAVAPPLSASSSILESPPCHTIQVPVLDPYNSKLNSNVINNSNSLHPPTILLEVPNKCLSPIREVPTPMPSPSITPIFGRHYISSNVITSSSQDSLDTKINSKNNHPSLSSLNQSPPVSMKKLIRQNECCQYPQITFTNSDENSTATSSENGRSNKKPDKTLIIPAFNIQEPSPTDEMPTFVFHPGTPTANERRLSNSSNGSCTSPPIITVTCMNELDSDPDSPANNKSGSTASGSGMCFLSPFPICSRADRNASESNLCSSGYSSMASPGPSRCGSNNPLCPSEVDDQSNSPPHRKLSPMTRTTVGLIDRVRRPSDSETLSDDHLLESNDEGFITDHLDQKIQGAADKNARELEKTLETTQSIPLIIVSGQDLDKLIMTRRNVEPESMINKSSSLVLPSIVINDDDDCLQNETRSPISSRSESPVSDRATTAIGRFSPLFYGKLTDSDGIYDCTSSECLKPVAHRKHLGKRREKNRSKSPAIVKSNECSSFPITTTGTPTIPLLLDIPGKSSNLNNNKKHSRKPSPKRRPRSQKLIDSSTSSSSSENLSSRSRRRLRRPVSPYLLKNRFISKSSLYSTEASEEDNSEEVDSRLGYSAPNLTSQSKCKGSEKLIKSKAAKVDNKSFLDKLTSIISHKSDTNRSDTSSRKPLLKHSKSIDDYEDSSHHSSKNHQSLRSKSYRKLKQRGHTD